MPSMGHDSELVTRVNRGEAAAFEEIYQRHRDYVFRLARRRLENTDDALDVLQDAFLNLLARFPGFELRSEMTTFLYPIVDHLCRDRLLRRRPTVDIDDAAELEAPTVQASSAPQMNLLLRLEPDQQKLLTLRFVDDLSLPQLAETLGVPIGTIKSRLNRAITALRDKLAGSGRRMK